MEHVQTRREIQAVLTEAGVRPRRRFGQHFLVDGNLMRRLVEFAELEPGDCVLEVGPGTGGLTDLLIPRVRRVIAVEIDKTLHGLLVERFAEAQNLTLILGDVLDGKHHLMPSVAGAIVERGASPTPSGGEEGGTKLVANLPYQVATPLLMNLLVDYPQVRRMCFTVQAEVGERLTAAPGSKDYGPLSIVCQSLCTIATIARIGPQCFWPVPRVDSVMLRLDVRERSLIPRDELPAFVEFVRLVFEHRRKQLRTALTYLCGERVLAGLQDRFDLTRRAEELTISEWLPLFRDSGPRSELQGQGTRPS